MLTVRRRWGGSLGVLLSLAMGVTSIMRPAGSALAAATISVDATRAGATVPPTAVGLNTAVWDGHLMDAPVPSDLQGAGAALLRFPGGSTADVYHWQTNSITPGAAGYANPANSFDAFMKNVVGPAGASAMVTVNYGSNITGTGGGDPSEAAAWVNEANNVKHYGVKYWEIGNEVYGNGYYGSAWEEDLHSDHSPTAYAQNALSFISAMKAQDSGIQVGLVLTAPGNWPDGQGPEQWNPTVLQIACAQADFVSVHWYAQSPGSESDSGLLASTASIAGMVSALRSQLSQYCGAHGSQMGIFVTESNSVSYNPGKQTTSVINGLFLLQDYLEWLQAGVQNVTWWDLHNGPDTGNNNSPSLAGTTSYGDYGVLSTGDSPEPQANTPFPTYTALQMLHSAAAPGSAFVPVTSSASGVNAYGLLQSNGQLALVLVNTSSTAPATVSPSVIGWTGISGGSATTFSLASPTPITTSLPAPGGSVTYTLPPYSGTVLLLSALSSATPSVTETATPTSTATATATATSTATATATSTATATATSTPSAALVLGNFETGLDGFVGNSLVTNAGPSTWAPTVALGSHSLWVQYTVPSAWAEARLTRSVNTDLSAYSTLSASVYVKQPTTATAVRVRFDVLGSDGLWHSSPYTTVPIGTRTTVAWTMGSVPRAPLRQVAVCWQFTTGAVSSGNEIWFDAVEASS